MNKEDIRKAFGKKLRHYRKAAGVTQMELAKAIGYDSIAAISKIENGSRDMPRSKIKLAADRLGVSPLVFFQDTATDTDQQVQGLIDIFNQLPLSRKTAVLLFAEYQLDREKESRQSND